MTLLSYSVKGKGENTIVLLHGFLEDSSMWDDLESIFTKFKTILIDLPGHGMSKNYQLNNFSMSNMALEVQNILKQENIFKPIVIGHSMGGYVGLELMQLIEINQLILFNSNFWADSEERKVNRNRLIQVVGKNKSLFLNEAIPNLFAVENLKIKAIQSKLIQLASEMNIEEIIKSTEGLRDRKDHTELVEQNSEIIKIVQADLDPIIPAEEMKQKVGVLKKQPEIHFVRKSGHMSVWENLKATKSVLTNLVSQD